MPSGRLSSDVNVFWTSMSARRSACRISSVALVCATVLRCGSPTCAARASSETTKGGVLRRRPPCRNFGGDPRSQELAGQIVAALRTDLGAAPGAAGRHRRVRPGRRLAGRRRRLHDRLGHRAVRRQHVDRPTMGALGHEPGVAAVSGRGTGFGGVVAGPGGAFGGGRLAVERCRVTGGVDALERATGA